MPKIKAIILLMSKLQTIRRSNLMISLHVLLLASGCSSKELLMGMILTLKPLGHPMEEKAISIQGILWDILVIPMAITWGN